MLKTLLILAMGAVCAHLAVDDAAAQIRQFDPKTGGSSQIGKRVGGQPTPAAPAAAPEKAAEEVLAEVVQKNPLGAAMVFIDAKTELNAAKMSELLTLRDLRGQGLLIEFYRKDENVDMRAIDREELTKNVIEIVKMLPQAVVGEEPVHNEMTGLPDVSYDHENEIAKENGVTVFPAVVYQITPDAERKVFPIDAGIDKFMSAVNDRKRELKEKR